MLLDTRKKEIYRLLQAKGFGLPQIQCAEYLINDEINYRHFKEGLDTCENCSLGATYCSEKVLGQGPITSPLMIVGDSASDDDENTKIPFTGPAGYLLTMALQVLNVDRRAIYYTNTIKCKSAGTPAPDEIATCKPYLEYELNRVKPKVIIALGNTATKALTDHFEVNISKTRGCYVDKGDMRIYPTWHPDYILLQQGINYIKARDEFIFDLNQAIEYIKKLQPNYRWIL